jgi:hypothetical protein
VGGGSHHGVENRCVVVVNHLLGRGRRPVVGGQSSDALGGNRTIRWRQELVIQGQVARQRQ